jgi:hyperosmotically inducible protein
MNFRHISLLTIVIAVFLLAACTATDTTRSTGQVIDDSAMAAEIKTRLAADSLTDGLDIDVEVDRDRVQLNGFVESAAERDRAIEIARSVAGNRAVDHNLEITEGQRTAGEYIDDKTLITKVNAALADDQVASSLDIDVEVNRGEVTLGGFVDSETQRQAAIDTVRNVSGVRNIVNNLKIRG